MWTQLHRSNRQAAYAAKNISRPLLKWQHKTNKYNLTLYTPSQLKFLWYATICRPRHGMMCVVYEVGEKMIVPSGNSLCVRLSHKCSGSTCNPIYAACWSFLLINRHSPKGKLQFASVQSTCDVMWYEKLEVEAHSVCATCVNYCQFYLGCPCIERKLLVSLRKNEYLFFARLFILLRFYPQYSI